jgi:hypothetical protein
MLLSMVLLAMNCLLSQTTWNGSLNTDWSNAGNWSAGVPDAADDVTIPNMTNDPVISTSGAVAKSVTVESGSVLTIAAAGTLTINGAATQGLLNQGTVHNNGTLSIGGTSGVGSYGIHNQGTFNNNTGGQLAIDRSTSRGINNDGGTFTNQAAILIGNIATVGADGLFNTGTFNNNTGGQITIDRSWNTGVYVFNGTITNQADIVIGSSSATSVYYGINLYIGTFNNNTGGQVTIERCSSSGISLPQSSGVFNNAGTVDIKLIGSTARLIYNANTNGGGMFNNNAGGLLKGTGEVNAVNFTNAGGTLSPGYSPGTLTFNASENFSNSTLFIEVNGTGSPGTNYDRVNVQGTATLGGVLALSMNYAGVNGDQVTIMSITSISGTFSSVTGLPANWYVNYFYDRVVLSYGAPLPVSNWTGNVNTDWNNAGNWSAGVPDAATDVTISNVANGPVISTAGAAAKSILVESGGVLTIAAGGTLAINGAATQGLLNQGTVHNNGILSIGGTSGVGSYGIRNQGTFNNNTGAQVTIDRSSDRGIFNAGGTFNNQAALYIGSIASAGAEGILSAGTFNNNTGGQITIDRVWNAGIDISSNSTFNNPASIVIGSSSSTNVYYGVTVKNATFNNNTGGQITLDRCSSRGISLPQSSGVFNNAGTVDIGPLSGSAKLISYNGSGGGTFNNNPGGEVRGTGEVSAVNFTNAGGALSPGYSPGSITFDAAENFSNCMLSMEVNGTGSPGTNFDQVVVSGTVTFGANTFLNVVFGYTPSAGSTFAILSATATSGTIPAGNITYSGGNVTSVSVTIHASGVSLTVNSILPVELVRFTGKQVENSVLLEWGTAAELNNEGFFIERSTNGIQWEEIGFMRGNGTASEVHNYTFFDEKPLPGINYYRLRQVDFDGKEELSKVVSVDFRNLEDFGNLVQVFPNPVSTGELNLLFSENLNESFEVRLFSPAGQLVRTETIAGGSQKLDVSNLVSGVYTLQVWSPNESGGAGRFFEKIVVQK